MVSVPTFGLDLVLGYRHRARILAWVLEKKGVFTLVLSEYHTQAPCPLTKCERCLIIAFGICRVK